MDHRAAPAALPALGVLAGAALGLDAAWLPVPLALALLAAALALGGGAGRLVAGMAAGLLAAAVGPGDPGGPWPGIDPARPVEAVGEILEPWRRTEWAWRSELRVDRLRQGNLVLGTPRRVAIELPDEEPPPAVGSRVRARGYLGRPPGYANRIPAPPGPWRLRVKTGRLLEVTAPPGPVAEASGRLRARIEAAIAAAEAAAGAERGSAAATGAGSAPLGPEAGHGTALVRALVLGDYSRLPPRWWRGLRRTGLAHLIAVSGLHAGLVAGAVLLLTGFLPRPPSVGLALAAVACYLAVVGPLPSMLRATGMALIAGAALLARRGPAAGNALAVVAAGLVLARPELVMDLGFRLSVAATAGIVFLTGRLEAAWTAGMQPGGVPAPAEDAARGRRRGRDAARRWLVRALAASAGAQLASLPFSLPAFHLASWSAPLVNLVAVPYTALVLAAGFGWIALAFASPAAAGALAPLLDRLAAPFGWPAEGPPAAWGVVAAPAPAPAVCLVAALATAWLLAPRRRLWLLPALVACWAWCAAAPTAGSGSGGLAAAGAPPAAAVSDAGADGRAPSGADGAPGTGRGGSEAGADGAPGAGRGGSEAAAGPVSLTLLDVGQGDAVLLRDGGQALLVDGGGWRHGDFGGRVLLPALLGEGVRRLDAVALTHPDADHCHGLEEIASYLPVGEVWLAPQWAGDRCADGLAATPGARVVRLAAGGRRRVGRWRLAALHPAWPAADRPAPPGEHNRLSLVLRAEAAGRCAVLTGDLDQAGEREVLARRPRLDCDLLKVGHHGSKSSTGPALLAAVRPRLALVSAGRGNAYGHPAAEVVARLERAGATVLSTQAHGLVRIAWREGGPLVIETPAAPP